MKIIWIWLRGATLISFFIGTASYAAPIPTATGSQPGAQLIGEPFDSQVCFTNTGDAIGFGPQFEMVTPAGITLTNAQFYSFGAIAYEETCTVSECNVTNPETAQVRTINENETYYVLDYPIGSYSDEWPEQCIDLNFALESSGSNVQLGNPLDIETYPLFTLGATAVDDGTFIYGTQFIMTVDPTVLTLEKNNDATEGERATGPSYPITATLSVDVADGEDVSAVQVTDTLSAGMQFVSLVSDGGCNASAPVLPSTVTPGGILTLDCDNVTGVIGVDRTITYTYYIPEEDDTAAPILGPNGQWQTLINQAEAIADYNGSALTPAEANSTVVAKAITMHKTSALTNDVAPSGFGPGDTVTYTLSMDVSDYFNHNGAIVTDILGDGQHVNQPLVANYALSTGQSGTFLPANISVCAAVDPVDGTCEIDFDLSSQIGTTITNGTTITISFDAVIDTNYQVINDAGFISMGDTVTNSSVVQSNIPGVGAGIPDGSGTSNTVATEQLVKSIYAINGSTAISAPYKIFPGDTVTYRLKSVMPVKSFYDLNITDYLPVPIFVATEITAGADTNSTPAAGNWDTGPDNNYDGVPTLSTDASQNTITFSYSDDNSNTQSTVLDLLFTVTATSEPMADSLELANIAATQYNNAAEDNFGSAGIINIETQAPEILADNLKSIVSSSNANSQSITPPDGFESALNNVDANDTITYLLNIRNTGHATAYDVNISDRFFQNGVADQGLHDCTIINIEGNSTGTGGGDLFAGVYSIDQIEAGAHYDIRYTCVVDQDANPGGDINNTATLLSYASQPGGPNFVNKLFESKTKLELAEDMQIVKNIASTSIPDTSGSSINQGEIVNFEIIVTLGEGTYTNYALTDNTCTNLQLSGTSANVTASGLSGTVIVDGTGGSVDGTLTYTCETQAIASGTNTATVTADVVGSETASTNWTVVDPNVVTSKNMNPSQADAGDTVTVTMDWTNHTAHPAYKCTVTDPLDTSVFDTSTVAMTVTPSGYTCNVVGSSVECVYTGDLTLPCPDGPAEFTVDVRDDVNTSANLVNEISFTGETLPSGHINEGDPVINGSVESNATDTLELRSPVQPVKVFTATSENFTDPGDTNLNATPDVAIGEVIDVNITYGFYEGTTLNVDLDERFLDGGRLVYVPGTMEISRSDNDLIVEDVDINSALAGVGVGVAVAVDDSKLTLNDTLIRLPLGDVTNLNSSSTTSTADLTLHFSVKVQNESSVQAGTLIRDRGRVRFEDSISGATRSSQSAIRSARTYEPLPAIAKDVNQTSVRAGSEITYTLHVCNDETNTGSFVTSGFDWVISDRIPDDIVLSSGPTVDLNGTSATVDTSVSSGQDINATIDRLDQGECLTIAYEAIVQQSAQFGEVLSNTANFSTTTLPGSYGSAGNLPGLGTQEPGESNGERTGVGGVNDLFGSDMQSVTMRSGFIEKRVVSLQQYYAIGEEVHYQIDMGTPAGSARNVIVNDILPVGLELNTSTVSYRLGNNLTVEFPSPTPVQNGQVVSFEFGDVNASALTGLIIDYNATVANVLSNQDGISLQNDVNVTFTDPNNPSLEGVLTPFIPASQIVVGEPNIEIQKSITAGAVGAEAGDSVSWQVILSNDPANNAHTTAYAVDWEDVLPSHLADIQNAALTQTGADVNLTGQTVRLGSSHLVENNTTLSLPLFDLPVGSTVTITFDSIVQNDAVAGETQTNTTNASYMSLAGADGSLLGGRNSDNCGDDDDDSALNNYCESATADLIIDAGIAVDKRLQGTQVNYTIGQELTYEMRISLIEGITQNVILTDTLPAGLRYVSHTHQNGAPAMSYDFASADLNGGTSQNVIIDFGDVDNAADGNTTNDYIDVELTVLVENVAGNQNGDTPSNGDNADGSSVTVVSDVNTSAVTVPVPINIVEPDLNVTKSVIPDTQARGDIVTYTIRLAHSNLSTSDAYDINFTDTLPADLTYISGSVTGVPAADFAQNGQVLTFGFANLALGATRDISYKARISDTANITVPLVNSLETVYSGLPDANGSTDGGRNGTDGVGGALNDYALQTDAAVQPNNDELTPLKNVTWSSDENSDTVVSAGDHLRYDLSVTNNLPYDVGEVNVTDTLSPDVTLLLNSIRIDGAEVGNDHDWSFDGTWYNYANASGDIDLAYNITTNYVEIYWQQVLASGNTLDISFDVKINDGNTTQVLFLDGNTTDIPAGSLVEEGTVIENIFTVDSNRTVPTDSNEVNITTDQRGIAIEPVKRLTATDQSFTDPGETNLANTPPVAVGEVIDIELLFEFSGGTTRNVVLRDNFDIQHFVYVPNSTLLERSSDSIEVSEADLNSSFATADTIAVDDSKIIQDADGFSINIGDLFNDNYNDMSVTESLRLTFKLRVDNNVTVQAGVILNDHGGVSFSEYDPATNTSSVSELNSTEVGVVVVEPDVEITKTVNPSTAVTGDTLTYTIKVCNDESNTTVYTTSAFEWRVTDLLPDELDLVGDPQYNGSSMFSGRDMDVTIADIAPGDCVFLEYNVTVNGIAEFDQEINNTVRVESTSLPGLVSGERSGTGVSPNDLNSSSTATLQIEEPGVRKAVIEQKAYYPIGDIVSYNITLGFTGSARDLTIIDHFPDGLAYVPGSARLRLPVGAVVSFDPPLESNINNDWTFVIGDLNITAAGNLYLELNVTVEDIPSNSDGTQLVNTLDMSFTDPNTGAPVTIPADAPFITVGEPALDIEKTITTDLSVPKSAGDIISYQIVLTNSGTTTAYNVMWEDKVPEHTGEIHNPHLEVHAGTAYETNTTIPITDANFTISTVDEPDDHIVLVPFDLSPGASIVITFDTIIQPNVIPAETLVNSTSASTQSIPSGGRETFVTIGRDAELTDRYNTVSDVSFTINQFPEAIDDCTPPLHVTHYGPNEGDLGSNDILGDGTKEEHTWRLITEPTYGTVVVNDDGTYIYTPFADHNDVQDSFTYEIEDSNGDRDQARVCIDVDCASSQTSDSGDALGTASMLMLAIMTLMTGLYFVRKEEERGNL